MKKFIWLVAAKIIGVIVIVGLVVYLMLPAKSAEIEAFIGGTPGLALVSLRR